MRLYIALFISALVLLQSCSSTNDVANDGLFQKRKYRKGLHGNFGSKDLNKRSIDSADAIVQRNDESDLDRLDYEPAENNKTKKWWFKDEPFELANNPADSIITQDKSEVSKDAQNETIIKRLIQPKVGKRYQSVGANKLREKLLQYDEPGMDARTQGIVSIVLGAVVIAVIQTIPLINLAASIAGMVFGKRARDGGEEQLGQIGWILSLIGLILSVLWILYWVGIILFIVLVEGI